MGGSSSIGSGRRQLRPWVVVLGGLAALALLAAVVVPVIAAIRGSGSSPQTIAPGPRIPPGLEAFVPAGAEIEQASDVSGSNGSRSAAVSYHVVSNGEDVVTLVDTAARAAGYEQKADATQGDHRVLAYGKVDGSQGSISLTLSPEGSGRLAVVALQA